MKSSKAAYDRSPPSNVCITSNWSGFDSFFVVVAAWG